ncbi:MAG: alpha/beta fold hydrolase [Pseudomonadota bacterium]
MDGLHVGAVRRISAISLVVVLGLITTQVLAAPCVVLLHGMGRTNWSMERLADRIEAEGYEVVNHDYPSRSGSIDELANTHVPQARAKCTDHDDTVHFVTHSLGGILVRAYYQVHPPESGSRAVMLGPPNQGSEVAEKLKDWGPYRWVMGEPGQSLGVGDESVPLKLKPIDLEVGIIAGTRSYNPLLSHWLPGPDDGKVAVSATKLSEMKDFISIKTTHASMMRDDDVIDQVVHFLKNGRFEHQSSH